ncbi:MAG: hypothetical protein Kow00106_20670 [Anaerolineae bacterium]
MTRHIVPRYKLMLFYDLATPDAEAYFQFVMSEMVPALHEMGLYLFSAFQTIPGDADGEHRLRQVEYVAEELDTIWNVLRSERWCELEEKLQQYVTNYSRKIVRFRQGFQL